MSGKKGSGRSRTLLQGWKSLASLVQGLGCLCLGFLIWGRPSPGEVPGAS